MSLKAKLEAVIYAAEEPVTLAQLAALFADDAFEWKAQQEAASAEQADETTHSLPLSNEEFASLNLEPNTTLPDSASVPAEQAEQTEQAAEAQSETGPEPVAEAAADTGSADPAGA